MFLLSAYFYPRTAIGVCRTVFSGTLELTRAAVQCPRSCARVAHVVRYTTLTGVVTS